VSFESGGCGIPARERSERENGGRAALQSRVPRPTKIRPFRACGGLKPATKSKRALRGHKWPLFHIESPRGQRGESRASTSSLGARPDFLHLLRALPQAIRNVHRIRTAGARFLIAKFFWMRESALTAGVDVTLPVIAQGWFCSSCPRICESRVERHAAEGSQNVKAWRATRALRPPQKTVSPSETATEPARFGCNRTSCGGSAAA
jgi:hypothetical protein